jgi:hypothetical protein
MKAMKKYFVFYFVGIPNELFEVGVWRFSGEVTSPSKYYSEINDLKHSDIKNLLVCDQQRYTTENLWWIYYIFTKTKQAIIVINV